MSDHFSREQEPDYQSAAKNFVKKNWKSSAVYLVLLGILCTFLSVLGIAVWLIIAVVRFLYVHNRTRRTEEAGRTAESVTEKECELCGIPTDTLLPVITDLHGQSRTLHVCGDCYHANTFRKSEKKVEFAEDEAGNGKHLLRETEAGRDARIARLAEKRNSGVPLQEDLFIEDIEDAKTVRTIVSIWESYDFGADYPEIDAVLSGLKNKDKSGYLSPTAVSVLKKDLISMIRGEDLFICPEEKKAEKPVIPEPSDHPDAPETAEQPAGPVPEQIVPAELPENLLYCRKCNRLYPGNKCPDCGTTNGRIPLPDDPCFLIDLHELQSNMLADALRQRGIPFMKDQVSGIGDVTREEPPMHGIFRFYALYKHFADALAVLDSLPISTDPEDE